MKEKKYLIILLSFLALLLISIIISAPYYTVYSIKKSIAESDAAILDTRIDFDEFVPSLKREYKNFAVRSLKSENIDADNDGAERVAKKLADGILTSSDILDKIPFNILQARSEYIQTKLRFLDFSTLEVILEDSTRPILLPNFIICRKGLLTWKMCKASFDQNLLIASVSKEKNFHIFGSKEKNKYFQDANLLPKDFTSLPFEEDVLLNLNEFYNIVTTAFGKKDSAIYYDPFGVDVFTTDGKYRVSPKAVMLHNSNKQNRYSVLVNMMPYYDDEKNQSILSDCHACVGKLASITFEYKDRHIKDIKVQQLGEFGVWGNVGEINHVLSADKNGIALVNGSCWQGECSKWINVFEQNEDDLQFKELKELHTSKDTK